MDLGSNPSSGALILLVPVIQLEETRPSKSRVVGSNPIGDTLLVAVRIRTYMELKFMQASAQMHEG